jgi:hypothetical protein
MSNKDWDLLRGWQAARAQDEFNEFESPEWKEGYRLFHERVKAKQRKYHDGARHSVRCPKQARFT